MFNLCFYVNRVNKCVAAIYTRTLHFEDFYCKFRTPATFRCTTTTIGGTTTGPPPPQGWCTSSTSCLYGAAITILSCKKEWLGRDFGFVPLSLTLEEGDESWRLTRQERRQGIGGRAARKKRDATPKKNLKNSLNQAFQKLPRRPIRPDTKRWRPDASVGCSSCSSIYTIFHHPNHLESFTKVVPKTLICLGDQLSSPFHIIHCTFPLETSRSTKEQTLGDLEAKRSEEEGASIILETSRAAGFHHWDFLNSLFIFI